MQIKLTQYASRRLEILKEHLQAEDSDVVEEAIIQLYDSYVQRGEIVEKKQPSSLIQVLSSEGLLKRQFKCTIKRYSKTEEELIIEAENEEDAWEQAVSMFPSETEPEFDIQEIHPFDFLD